MNMIERVAEALVKERDKVVAEGWDDVHHGVIGKRLARAAIAAMREPTDEMLRNVAVNKFDTKDTALQQYHRAKDMAKLNWQSMIDKELEE
jgi:hypothetical protein